MIDMVCRCCGSRSVQEVLDLGSQPHCNRLVGPCDPEPPSYPLRLGFCSDCTLVQIDHTIPKEKMFSDYPYVSGTTGTLDDHFRESTARLSRMYNVRSGDLVVDIGSNDGTWLKHWMDKGCQVIGIEPARNVWQIATEYGVPTWNRFFNEDCAHDVVRHHGQPASLVTAAGVFFHLEELHKVIRGCKLAIGKDGILVVQCIYLGDMIENTAFDQIYHEHLCYYTLRSLCHLVGIHGLEVFDVRMCPIHGGTMEAHIGIRGAHDVTDRVMDILEHERVMGYGEIETYQTFAKNVYELRDALVDMLTEYYMAGCSVWALGAPAKGATLLNTLGIDRKLVQMATERNPLKVGKEIPGCRIPIVEEIPGANPDAYLVLAWNFLDELKKRYAGFLGNGGQFIVPVPELQVIG